jgi:hypothetical protein
MQEEMKKKLLGFAFIVAALLSVTGCTASSEFMRPATAGVPPAAGEQAQVVFIRPSGYAGAIKTTIVGGHGEFLGDSLAESYFAVSMPPGEHMFIAWAENTAVLRANLAPGKTYYVEVSPKMGAWSARMHLMALKPGSENWGELQSWLAASSRLEPDRQAGQSYLAGRQDDVAERLRRANEALTEYTPEELAERTLGPDDGQ